MALAEPAEGRNQVRNQIGPGTCTGACCDRFTLVVNGEYAGLAEVRKAAEDGNPTAAPWGALAFEHPPALDDDEDDRGRVPIFGCREWDPATGRCRIYAARPDTCRDYPALSACRHCGARSSAEAAGVALMVVTRCT